MASSMKHRGPDDEGIWVGSARDATIGLCARRLAVQDPTFAGHQPMSSPLSGCVAVLNGEIYNVAELRQCLERDGYRFKGSSDTEIVVHAYDRWGSHFVDHFRGMFAIALWDPCEHRLLLCRDRLGIKPLYFAEIGTGLIFASEIRTLLASRLISPRLSMSGVGSYLRLGAVQEPFTILEAASPVRAGHVLTWCDGQISTSGYWSLLSHFAGPAFAGTRDAAVAAIRAKLEDAVLLHLVSDVPLGVFLSGGIDSTALVGLVSRVADTPPRTVSVVFPEQAFSEEHFISTVQKRYQTDHTSVHLDGGAASDYIPRALAAMDQPSVDGVNTFVVSAAARESGLTVALSGVGGDELFGGYDKTFRRVPQLVALHRLPRRSRVLMASLLDAVGRTSDRNEKLKRWLCTDASNLSAAWSLSRELFSSASTTALMLDRDAAASLSAPALLPDAANSISLAELGVFMQNMLLRDMDFMSMAHSLELRVPLLDHELVELVASLPGAWKGGASPSKPLLVDAVSDLVPREVYARPKMGFVLPYDRWLRSTLQRQVEHALLDREYGGPVAAALSPTAVRDVWQRFRRGESGWTRTWSLFVLKAWAQANLAP
jgi:asparagine synthase (glutamine-hydrolysing)